MSMYVCQVFCTLVHEEEKQTKVTNPPWKASELFINSRFELTAAFFFKEDRSFKNRLDRLFG